MVELIITEKPQASLKIAAALADYKPIKQSDNGVPYYKICHNRKDIIVACAVGHLYGLAEKEKNGWNFPVFDVEWIPASEQNKQAAFSKKYLNTLKKLSKECAEFTVACDYDVEGEVIGLNIIRFACRKKDASRMKFSTLTKDELVDSYEHKSKTLDWGQARAGETRHIMDWYYGINISRALTSAIKSSGMFKIMSSGRVQAPALKIVVDREKEISSFKPVPYWEIQLLGALHKDGIEAWHINGKFWEKAKADKVMQNVKGKKQGIIDKVEATQFKQFPPFPFDLTALQMEAYRCFRISPKDTLAVAQDLYTSGFISYPRTSSQQLPSSINYKKIMSALARQPNFSHLIALLLKSPLRPNEGKKSDPAHPSIYPTGETPSGLKDRHIKIYDLVVRRFMAVFGSPAARETVQLDIDVNKETFVTKGTRTIEKGWHIFYEPYLKLEEQQLPKAKKGDIVDIKKINLLGKETQPPKRYTPASIIKELEKKGLGTKSTRAQIIDTLFQRNYIEAASSISATGIGIKTCEIMEEFFPKVVDEALTRRFEDEMEEIREGKKSEDNVLAEAKGIVSKTIDEFKQHEKKIGARLAVAHADSEKKSATVGKCPVCGSGDLVLRRGKFGRFIACSAHPDCKTTFSLPASGMVKVSDKVCEHCNHPMIMMIRKAKKPQEVCINKECKSKKVEGEHKIKEKPCPKCKEGKMVLRKSVYGSFLGCSNYPKCRNIEKLPNGNNSK